MWCVLAVVLLLLVPTAATSATAASAAGRSELDDVFREQLRTLAEKCDELGLERQATVTREWFIPRDADRQYLFVPATGRESEGDRGLRPPDDAPRLERLWYEKFRELRGEQAKGLFELAGEALGAERSEAAYRLLHEVLREDPDHAEARRILGYSRSSDTWSRPEQERRVTRGVRNLPQLGWRRRGYWVIESENYRILTSGEREAGEQLAEQLERLHDVWRQAFFAFWGSESALRARFGGQDVPLAPRRQYQVVLFRDRQEYLERMGRIEPLIAKTVGYYLSRNRTAYFYAADPAPRSTWYHEASHQLFQESMAAVPDPGADENFWIVEGAALYMESLRDHGDHCRLGGWDADRLQFARYRTLYERFQVPLGELTGYGRRQLQQDDRIGRIYSQAAGLTHFLLDGQGGAYRGGLIDYLRGVYRGESDGDSLFRHLERSAEELDAAYRRFLDVRDEDLMRMDSPADIRNLCLSRTSVTDQGLRVLDDCRQLEWLDLSHTRASGATIARLEGAKRLRQLSLENTRIGDDSLKTIGRLPALEELDLSETDVTDEGLAHLQPLAPRLKVLWLTGTRISDAGLEHLRALRKLETLDVNRTRVTQPAWDKLRASLPKIDG